MEFIFKKEFSKQLNLLLKKYDLILDDFDDFTNNFNIDTWKHLWKGIYKFRMKNSSNKTWKSWGFRIIIFIKIIDNKALPFIIYSKTDRDNISLNDIIKELQNYI